ncbi:MAG TPA: adenylate/guanylate cyclase domain-containing protein [Acidimicrobiales bacterium]|nr:adenylate/guanylate cyclase domain-containing protein [Acidimicrobiales bacterium]
MGRFAAWLWGRYRRHYSLVVAGLAVLAMHVALTVPVILLAAEVLELSFRETLVLAAMGLGFITFGAAAGVASLSRPRHAIDAFGRGEAVDPVEVWNAALDLPSLYPRRANLFQVPLDYGVMVPYLAVRADMSALQAVCAALTVVQLQVAGGLIFGVGMRILFRPLLEELMPDLPLDAEPTRRGSSLRYRVLMACWLGCMTMSVVGAAVTRTQSTALDVFAMSFLIGVPVSTYLLVLIGGGVVHPSLEPVRDLLAGTRRVAHGDYDESVPVTSADELGELATSFNQMQHGLQQRAALQTAFGSYVDPALTQRLLESGSSVFEGEDVEVTVLFADVRDFTGFASRIEPADAVAHLNRLFDVIVPVLHDHGGHANHYLGDGLLAIFGAPSPLERHADAALAAAIDLQRRVRAEFGRGLKLGVGINTGKVIAGTVGGGGRLEFTVIGDTVNVASRVEQATKETGDAILLTQATRDMLTAPLPRLTSRGGARFRGKHEPVVLYAVNPFPRAPRGARAATG